MVRNWAAQAEGPAAEEVEEQHQQQDVWNLNDEGAEDQLVEDPEKAKKK